MLFQSNKKKSSLYLAEKKKWKNLSFNNENKSFLTKTQRIDETYKKKLT